MVPNTFPSHGHPHRRIAIIGESPGAEEVRTGLPFMGVSGRFLWDSLKDADVHRSECFVGNVSQERPPGDKIKLWKWSCDAIQTGIATLREDLTKFQPTFIVLLGGTALRAVTGEPHSIDSWKNTLFMCSFTGIPVKTLACYHPAAVLRDDTRRFWWHHQMQRIAAECNDPALLLPQRTTHIHTKPDDAISALRSLHGQRLAFDLEGYAKSGPTSFALSPSATTAHVFPFRRKNHTPVYGEHEETIWSEFAALVNSYNLFEPWRDPASRLLCQQGRASSVTVGTSSWTIPPARKGFVTHNGLYDAFVLSYSGRPGIHNVIVDDTMVLWWELFAEVDKDLASLASVLTREPFYKAERKSPDDEVVWTYNGKDTCITYECADTLYARPEWTEAMYTHYGFNMALILPILYMELRGIRFDDSQRSSILNEIQRRIYVLQDALNQKAGVYEAHPWFKALTQGGLEAPPPGLISYLRSFCAKRPRRFVEVPWVPASGPRKGQQLTKRISSPASIETLEDVAEFALSPHSEMVHELSRLLQVRVAPRFGCADRGQLSQLLRVAFNIDSPKANDFLYGKPPAGLGLPPQYKVENGRKTDRLTHDSDALLNLYLTAQRQPRFKHCIPILKCWLRLAAYQTQTETLSKPADFDGRMRCSYNHVGPGTGRFSCSTSAANVGYNLQTVTKRFRKLFIADEGCLLGQHDLEGADGWTVAAYCAAVGDDTMLLDYAAKLKPARVATLIMDHGVVVNDWSRDQIKEAAKQLPDDWRYLAMKRVAWGTCYLMGLVKMSEQILGDSYAKGGVLTFVPVSDCRRVQGAFLARYWGIPKWQAQVAAQVLQDAYVETCVGHRRYFFGRIVEWKEGMDGHKSPTISRSIHGTALSDLPQEHTTLATKLALFRLYYSPENRDSGATLGTTFEGFPRFRVEPLHTVHDSVNTQFRIADREWAGQFIHECFQNTLHIAGHPIIIPVAGECSPNWGMKNAEKL